MLKTWIDIEVSKKLQIIFGMLVLLLCIFLSSSANAKKMSEKVEIDSNITEITSKIDDSAWYNTQGIQNNLEKLRNAANGEMVLKWGQLSPVTFSWEEQYLNVMGADSKMEDVVEDVRDAVKEALAKKQISQTQAATIMYEAEKLYKIGNERAQETAKDKGNDGIAERIKSAQNDTLSSENLSTACPTMDEMKAKYTSDCYGCLVVNSLVTAFMKAASKVYVLAQEAGIKILGIGAVLWILTFFLKNMASLTSLEPMNILNEFVKMGFKILLAYTLIVSGISVVTSYFVGPFMGFGAVFAQQLWAPEIKAVTEDYIWEEYDYADIDKKYEEAKQKQEAEMKKPQQQEVTPVKSEPEFQVDTATTERLKAAQQQSLQTTKSADGKNINIPSFKIPGAMGTFSSPFGCRPPPSTSGGKGSNVHKGIDIGNSAGATIYAIGSGTVVYSNSATGGYTATINHGSGWMSIYHHMLPKSDGFAIAVNKKSGLTPNRVAQGQQIGFMGNTGNSGGVHLHLGVKYGGNFVDPLSLTQKRIVYAPSACPQPTTQANRTPPPPGFVRGSTRVPTGGWGVGGMGTEDLSSTFIAGADVSGGIAGYMGGVNSIGQIRYEGPTEILSASIMNSILGATEVITSKMAENMVLGNALTCFAGEKNGGAWKLVDSLWFDLYMTNWWMWLCGAIIWCCGFMLTLAVTYYLLDISFKLAFAVMALPIVIGLWPFNVTKGKLTSCMSIILKSSATFAFLAITTGYAMVLISKSFGDGGIDALYAAIEKDDAKYVSERLSLLGEYFIILVFCLVYSFKMIGATIPELADKFFPDQTFGNQAPMHRFATTATDMAKKAAMAPAKLARDIALTQTGALAGKAVKGTVGKIANAVRGGSKKDKNK